MIEKLFNHPHLLHQTPDSETDVANEAIAGQIDNGGTIVLSQEGRHIWVNRERPGAVQAPQKTGDAGGGVIKRRKKKPGRGVARRKGK
jgi:hypothetical protein